MSIVRTALRIATRKAIEGRTMAETRVRDSSIVSLEDALSGAPQPVVLIYTDDAADKPNAKDIWGTAQTIDIVLVVAVAGAYKVKVKDSDEEEVEFAFPPTDAASEVSIDVIERQIKMALTDPRNPWAEIWKGLIISVDQWNSTRGASSKEGQRFAARQIVIRVQPVDDPIPGGPAKGAWEAFLQAASEDGTLGKVPDVIRALIEGKTLAPEVRAAIELGITVGGVEKIGLGRWRLQMDGPEHRVPSYVLHHRPLGDRTE